MKLLNLKFIPQSADLALLLVRVLAGFSLIYAHGWKKVTSFGATLDQWTQWGVNPIGIGPGATLTIAVFTEVLCALLLIVGLKARFASLFIAVQMLLSFFLMHAATFADRENSGELAYLYFASAVLVLFAGPGKFSVDGRG